LASFLKRKNLRIEDHTYLFPSILAVEEFGKKCSAFEILMHPQYNTMEKCYGEPKEGTIPETVKTTQGIPAVIPTV
jgi:hypothetical protein